jgi:hypothetical protein
MLTRKPTCTKSDNALFLSPIQIYITPQKFRVANMRDDEIHGLNHQAPSTDSELFQISQFVQSKVRTSTVSDNLLKYLKEYGTCHPDKTSYKNKYLVTANKGNTALVLKHQATKAYTRCYRKVPTLGQRRNVGLTYSILAAFSFKTVSLRMYTVIPSFFPLFKSTVEIIFLYAVEYRL